METEAFAKGRALLEEAFHRRRFRARAVFVFVHSIESDFPSEFQRLHLDTVNLPLPDHAAVFIEQFSRKTMSCCLRLCRTRARSTPAHETPANIEEAQLLSQSTFQSVTGFNASRQIAWSSLQVKRVFKHKYFAIQVQFKFSRVSNTTTNTLEYKSIIANSIRVGFLVPSTGSPTAPEACSSFLL